MKDVAASCGIEGLQERHNSVTQKEGRMWEQRAEREGRRWLHCRKHMRLKAIWDIQILGPLPHTLGEQPIL